MFFSSLLGDSHFRIPSGSRRDCYHYIKVTKLASTERALRISMEYLSPISSRKILLSGLWGTGLDNNLKINYCI